MTTPAPASHWYVIAEAGVDVGTVWIELLPAGCRGGPRQSSSATHHHSAGASVTAAIGLAVAEFRREHRHVPIVLRVRRSNARAVACYRRAGFTVTGSGTKPLPSGRSVPYYRMTCLR